MKEKSCTLDQDHSAVKELYNLIENKNLGAKDENISTYTLKVIHRIIGRNSI